MPTVTLTASDQSLESTSPGSLVFSTSLREQFPAHNVRLSGVISLVSRLPTYALVKQKDEVMIDEDVY